MNSCAPGNLPGRFLFFAVSVFISGKVLRSLGSLLIRSLGCLTAEQPATRQAQSWTDVKDGRAMQARHERLQHQRPFVYFDLNSTQLKPPLGSILFAEAGKSMGILLLLR